MSKHKKNRKRVSNTIKLDAKRNNIKSKKIHKNDDNDRNDDNTNEDDECS